MPKFDQAPSKCKITKAHASLEDFVVSRTTGKKWLWIRIPKTATISYRRIFFPDIPRNSLQTHSSWWDFREDDWDEGFTLVRHPRRRFRSAIGHLAGTHRSHLTLQFRDTQDLVEFFQPIVPVFIRDIEDLSPTWVKKVFQPHHLSCKNCGFNVPNFISALFTPQVHWAYNPKIRFFKFEEMDKFNEFIERELGYDTSSLTHDNTSRSDLSHIDFDHPDVVTIVEQIYGIDFDVFEYGRETKST